MADNETSSFPMMGPDYLSQVVNAGGSRSSYMKYGTKAGFAKNDAPANSANAHRGKTEIHGAQGPACTITATISYAGSPEAAQTGRNLKRVRGPYSFELARAAAGSGYASGV